jgi:hypothetical protein
MEHQNPEGNGAGKSEGPADEAPIVLCVVCRNGISSARGAVMNDAGVAHVRCLSSQS